MKKKYLIPKSIVVRIGTEQMIAESFNGQGGTGQTKNGESTSDGLSRRGSFWEDEEE